MSSTSSWPLLCHKAVVFTCRSGLLAVALWPSSGWDWSLWAAAGCSLESTTSCHHSPLHLLHPDNYHKGCTSPPLWPVRVSWLWQQASAPEVLVQVTAQRERVEHTLLVQLSETALIEETNIIWMSQLLFVGFGNVCTLFPLWQHANRPIELSDKEVQHVHTRM